MGLRYKEKHHFEIYHLPAYTTHSYHLMYSLNLAVASLIGFTHEYAFQRENHPLRTLFLYSSSANCHVLYKGLCAVAPTIQQNVSLASRLSDLCSEMKLRSS